VNEVHSMFLRSLVFFPRKTTPRGVVVTSRAGGEVSPGSWSIVEMDFANLVFPLIYKTRWRKSVKIKNGGRSINQCSCFKFWVLWIRRSVIFVRQSVFIVFSYPHERIIKYSIIDKKVFPPVSTGIPQALIMFSHGPSVVYGPTGIFFPRWSPEFVSYMTDGSNITWWYIRSWGIYVVLGEYVLIIAKTPRTFRKQESKRVWRMMDDRSRESGGFHRLQQVPDYMRNQVLVYEVQDLFLLCSVV